MTISNIADLRVQAGRRLPRVFFDYLDGGAFSELTMRRNTEDFDQWWLDQRAMVDVTERDLSATFLGATHALPMMLAPVGFSGMFWADGEKCAAQAAKAAGIPMALSTFSINSVEQVASVMPENLALQLYVFRDHSIAEDMMQRAWTNGVRTLFLTVDSDVSSIRERDTRNGFRSSARLSFSAMLDMAKHPSWCLSMMAKGFPELGNVAGRPGVPNGLIRQTQHLSANVDPAMQWKDLAWLRQHWKGKIVVKGLLRHEDVSRAIDNGVEGIVVSNHGGRQLDSARSTISILPEVAEHVAGRAEIFLDSGIRRGSHIIKALALGADAVLIGRAFAYGLAAQGRAGVAKAIDLLKEEASITMGLMGVCSIAELKANRKELIGKF